MKHNQVGFFRKLPTEKVPLGLVGPPARAADSVPFREADNPEIEAFIRSQNVYKKYTKSQMIRYDQIQILTRRISESPETTQAVNIEYDPFGHLEQYCYSRISDQKGLDHISKFISNMRDRDQELKDEIRELRVKIAKLEKSSW